jgi:hypothetical protein
MDNHADEIVESIHKDCQARGYDIISLGPGNGEKDRSLLHYFATLDTQHPLGYFPVDVSPTLISHACQEVLQDRVTRQKLRITHIVGDFEELKELRPVYWQNDKRNVFLLLGNTLGNYDENTLLRDIKNGIEPGDYLILEFQQKSDNDYSQEKMRFFRAPLKLMGFDAGDLRIETGPSFGSAVPGAKTYSTNAHLRREAVSFQLTHSTQYETDALVDWLATREFPILGSPFVKESVVVLVVKYTPFDGNG